MRNVGGREDRVLRLNITVHNGRGWFQDNWVLYGEICFCTV